MPNPHPFRALRLVALAAPLALIASTACRWDGEEKVGGVGTTLGPPGHISDVFLTAGDRDTIRAQAYTVGWPSRVKYDSEREPRRFTYGSSDPDVATVDADGVVTATHAGTTRITATVEGVTSSPATALTVVPPASELRASPGAIDAAVGDTVAVTVTAADASGADVAGVVFDAGLDTTVWAVIAEPAEGSWRLETPRVLHIRARSAGNVHLLNYSLNERAASRLQAAPVAITVRAAP